MPPAASKEARSKRPGPKPEPAEPIKRPKRNPLAKLYKDVAKAFYDFEELQDNTVILGTDLKDANSTIKDEHERNRNLQDEVTHLKAELRKCGRIIKKLSRENDAMKVDVLKQQPMSQAPDSQIADMYRSLQDKISSWIDTEIRTVEDGCVGTNGELNLSLNPSGRASREDASFLAKGFLFGGEYLLESIVQYKLHELLYSEDMMYFALACDDAIFLHSVEEGLPKLDPPRGQDDQYQNE
ncbi:MAG: hypothetical protein LQ343_006072 [Gyalolechia ehrenbergii]|nr:MAG: hypothetical protein LQ343_006072 [Gyalolechia ehrenbergii]